MSQNIGYGSDQGRRIVHYLQAWLPTIAWGVAAAMITFSLLIFFYNPIKIRSSVSSVIYTQGINEAAVSSGDSFEAGMPQLAPDASVDSVVRTANNRTIIASQPRRDVVSYVVQVKDSIFGIANKFKLKPETVFWANYDDLDGNADMVMPGMELKIPPVDGVYYQWKEGDTLEKVADEYSVKPQDILMYSPNRLEISNPVIETESYIMIPGGKKEIVQQWIIPVIPRGEGRTGVAARVLGSGACAIPAGGAYGTGTFIYPTHETRISGNDFWGGHLAIDLAVGMGDPLRASDGGVVIYSGWAGGGYGYTVMIDHGTGYQTLYAHLSDTAVRCGTNVYQGQIIGYGGSTGNSTGPHLHFEVRFMGGFVNPWYVLP